METHNVSFLQHETTTAEGPEMFSLTNTDSATSSYYRYMISAGVQKSGAIIPKFWHILP